MGWVGEAYVHLLCSGIVLILIGPRIGDPVSGIREFGGSFNSIQRGPFEASRGLFRTKPFRTESFENRLRILRLATQPIRTIPDGSF